MNGWLSSYGAYTVSISDDINFCGINKVRGYTYWTVTSPNNGRWYLLNQYYNVQISSRHSNIEIIMTSFLQPIIFIKPSVPDNMEEKSAFAKKLAKYGVSLKEYVKAFNDEEIVYVYHTLTL